MRDLEKGVWYFFTIPVNPSAGGRFHPSFYLYSDKAVYIGRSPNDTCASAALDKLARGKTKNFLSFLFVAPTPPPRSGKFERKEIFGFAAAASLLQKG